MSDRQSQSKTQQRAAREAALATGHNRAARRALGLTRAAKPAAPSTPRPSPRGVYSADAELGRYDDVGGNRPRWKPHR